jgi:hypothetical protein
MQAIPIRALHNQKIRKKQTKDRQRQVNEKPRACKGKNNGRTMRRQDDEKSDSNSKGGMVWRTFG